MNSFSSWSNRRKNSRSTSWVNTSHKNLPDRSKTVLELFGVNPFELLELNMWGPILGNLKLLVPSDLSLNLGYSLKPS